MAYGETILSLHAAHQLGIWAMPTGDAGYMDLSANSVYFPIDTSSTFKVLQKDGQYAGIMGVLDHLGGLDLLGPNGPKSIPALSLIIHGEATAEGLFSLDLQDASTGLVVFHVPVFDVSVSSGAIAISSDDLMLSAYWARKLGLATTPRLPIGSFVFSAALTPKADQVANTSTDLATSGSGGVAGTAPNPDVIVCFVQDSANSYGSVNNISAFAFGTTSANIGTDPVIWIRNTPQHPVIAQNVYRLKDDRFEHIGQSWLKHAFLAVAGSACGACQNPGTTALLGVGCSDPYSASLNGTQANLGPKFEIDAHTGVFPYPFFNPESTGSVIERRVQIHNDDLDPALNINATYFVEAQYITQDDAQAGNGNNNASYYGLTFSTAGFAPYTATVRRDLFSGKKKPAVLAWQEVDPSVVITEIQIPGEGLFLLGAKSWEMGDGFWAYEYALQNLNSHRSCGSLTLPIRAGEMVRNTSFHDVDYHSGEPFDGTDWPAIVSNLSINWSTTPYDVNTNANAVRWGTLYNFRFESNSPPAFTLMTLGLFRPGFPEVITVETIGPQLDIVDCNQNKIDDSCDISCAAFECTQPCGISDDCDANGVPDECQADCNANGLADSCDISTGGSIDCNGNTVPDDCEPDCDGDGIIDDCEPVFEDCDLDGIEDCVDLCPCTSGINACVCPALGDCCFEDFCFPNPLSPEECIEIEGVPECIGSPCRAGCLPSEVDGDFDRDGDVDFNDYHHLMMCFTSDIGNPAFVPPTDECAVRFDFNGDDDIDLQDYERFRINYTGPMPAE